ncbi:MAG: hypothetical protein AAGA85_13525 [Bacteroidota bacterium]
MKIGRTTYDHFLYYWTHPALRDMPGRVKDVVVSQEPDWLEEAAVTDQIKYEGGAWRVSLIYIHLAEPNTFFVKPMSNHPTYESARFNAKIHRRRALNDPYRAISRLRKRFDCPSN